MLHIEFEGIFIRHDSEGIPLGRRRREIDISIDFIGIGDEGERNLIRIVINGGLGLIPTLILSYHLRLGLPNFLFLFGLPTEILYAFLTSPMRAICPTSWWYLVNIKSYEIHHYGISFPKFLLLPPLRSKYSLQHPVLKNFQLIFFPLMYSNRFHFHTQQ
jgi:hypothetical protein